MDSFLTFANANSPAISMIATVALAVTTIIYAWSTNVIAKENRLLRMAGTEPEVVAYLLPNERYINFINLVIANVGRGPARNVSIEFEGDVQELTKRGAALMTKRAPTISVLPQDERFVHFFGSALDLLGEEPVPDFSIKVTFQSFAGITKSSVFRASIRDFEGLRRIGASPEHETADAMKKIAELLGNWSSGFKRLNVETSTTAELRAEQEKQHKMFLDRKSKSDED